MSWVAVAVGGAAVVGAYSSNRASQAQQDAAGDAMRLSSDQYYQTRADNAPWRATGETALNQLNTLLNNGSLTSRFTGANVANEPGYQFGMREGMRAINNSASARGGIGGAALMAGTRYAQDYAGTKYGQAFERNRTEVSDAFNRLSGIAGTGQQTNAANSTAGQNFANNAGAYMIGGGNAQTANALNQGNIFGNALNQYGAYAARPKPVAGGGSWGSTGMNNFFYGNGGVGD